MQSDITAKVKSYFLHTVSQYPIKVPTARITNWGAHIDSYTDDQLKAYNKEVQCIFGVERDKMVKKIKGNHNQCGLTSNSRTKLALYAVQLFDVAAVQNDDAQKRAALLTSAEYQERAALLHVVEEWLNKEFKELIGFADASFAMAGNWKLRLGYMFMMASGIVT
ncbi:hypothetical protein HDU78_010743, partial [Chytriomyces hyalinus]